MRTPISFATIPNGTKTEMRLQHAYTITRIILYGMYIFTTLHLVVYNKYKWPILRSQIEILYELIMGIKYTHSFVFYDTHSIMPHCIESCDN